MSDAKNKIAAQIIKAEMTGDQEKVRCLRRELNDLSKPSRQGEPEPASSKDDDIRASSFQPSQGNSIWDKINEPSRRGPKSSGKTKHFSQDTRVQKFLGATGSLSRMFESEKKTTSSDEVKGYIKTAGLLKREDFETKHFATEMDDSQKILDRSKKRQHDYDDDGYGRVKRIEVRQPPKSEEKCSRCPDRLPKHLLIEKSKWVFLSLCDAKPFLSSMSNVIISNCEHSSGNSFVAANDRAQDATEVMIEAVRDMWQTKGYRCIIMETYFRDKSPVKNELISCGNHFQVHCLPIKEKHFEKARMNFKQALQECEREWSMNKKLIMTGGRRIQRHLPKGLSYFWVCFDELTNGFGHVIEQENEFSQYFGLEVLSSLLDKDFNPMRLQQREEFQEQFERGRDFKILYDEFKTCPD